jgi:hypothetical protein
MAITLVQRTMVLLWDFATGDVTFLHPVLSCIAFIFNEYVGIWEEKKVFV